jgi:hypothetical protein
MSIHITAALFWSRTFETTLDSIRGVAMRHETHLENGLELQAKIVLQQSQHVCIGRD